MGLINSGKNKKDAYRAISIILLQNLTELLIPGWILNGVLKMRTLTLPLENCLCDASRIRTGGKRDVSFTGDRNWIWISCFARSGKSGSMPDLHLSHIDLQQRISFLYQWIRCSRICDITPVLNQTISQLLNGLVNNLKTSYQII